MGNEPINISASPTNTPILPTNAPTKATAAPTLASTKVPTSAPIIKNGCCAWGPTCASTNPTDWCNKDKSRCEDGCKGTYIDPAHLSLILVDVAQKMGYVTILKMHGVIKTRQIANLVVEFGRKHCFFLICRCKNTEYGYRH